jgi:two-component system, NarL family, sensor kinase
MNGSQGELIILIATTLLVLLGIVVWNVFVQKKKNIEYKQQLLDIRSQYEKALFENKLNILEDTFRAISQNLHDNLGSNISTAMLLLYKDDSFTDWDTEANRKEALVVLDKVLDDLKNISHSLNPDYLDEIGLNEAVKQRVRQLIRTKKYQIDLQQNTNPFRLNRQKQLILFYFFQEAMNNINTHAGASKVEVKMDYKYNHLEFEITDNGKGMMMECELSDSQVKGSGLLNMKCHAELISAKLDIKSKPDVGTKIKLLVPDPYK